MKGKRVIDVTTVLGARRKVREACFTSEPFVDKGWQLVNNDSLAGGV